MKYVIYQMWCQRIFSYLIYELWFVYLVICVRVGKFNSFHDLCGFHAYEKNTIFLFVFSNKLFGELIEMREN